MDAGAIIAAFKQSAQESPPDPRPTALAPERVRLIQKILVILHDLVACRFYYPNR